MTTDQAVPTDRSNGKPAKSTQYAKRPERPDFAERDEMLKTLQAKVQEYMALAKTKTSELESLQNESKASNKVEGLKRSLANTVHSRVQAQKLQTMTRKRLEDFQNPKRAVTKKGTDLASNPQDLLDKMEQLKDKVATEEDPQEVSRLIARIQALNASYVQLTDGSNGASAATDGVRSSLADDLAKYDAEVQTASTAEGELRDKLEELQEQLAAAQPNIERLRAERETCRNVVSALRDKMTSINDEWQAKFDAFKTAMSTWEVEKDAARKEREEQRQAEQKARKEEQEARDKEARGPPYARSIIRCDQMLTWCKKYGTEEEAAEEETKGAAEPVVFEGMVLKKKAVPGADDVFATSARNKSKKAPRKNLASDAKAAPAKIQHDMETLALFGRLKLPVPTTAEGVDEVRKTVEAKKSEYESLQARALAGEDVPAEEEDAPEPRKKGPKGGAAKKTGVALSLRCDEAFGMVLVELVAH